MDSSGAAWGAAAGLAPEGLIRRGRGLDPVAGALSAAGGGGALLLGEPGVGKTTVARQVLQHLGKDVYVERVRGGALVAGIPYGAIHYLLSEMDARLLEHPFRIVQGVGRLLRQRAHGRPVIVFADNAHLLDQQ